MTEVKGFQYTIMNNSINLFNDDLCWNAACELLEAAGVPVLPEAVERLNQLIVLVGEWNAFAHLVSAGDAARLPEHVVDSVSLTGYVRDGAGERGWIDIGTGGGFPALVVKCLLPEVPLWMVERNERKAGFLIRAVAALGLKEARVVRAEFPHLPGRIDAGVVTARAVERPEVVGRAILCYMEPGMTWLCQGTVPVGVQGAGFHVEHIEDAWSDQGLRRGSLHRIGRA